MGGCRTVDSGFLSSYLSCNFLVLRPFSTLPILLSTVCELLLSIQKIRKCGKAMQAFSLFHVGTHSKCGYSETEVIHEFKVQVSFRISFTPLGRCTWWIYRCSPANGCAAFIILCFGLQDLQQAAAAHRLCYLYKPVQKNSFPMNLSIFRIGNVAKKKLLTECSWYRLGWILTSKEGRI